MKGRDGECCTAEGSLIQPDLAKGFPTSKSSEDDGTLDYYHEVKVGKDDYDGYVVHGIEGEEEEEDESNRFLNQQSPEEEAVKDRKDCNGTVFTGVLNISNTIMGSGMLALPTAVAAVGLIPGIICLVFSACASGLGMLLLSRVALKLHPPTDSVAHCTSNSRHIARPGRGSPVSFASCCKCTFPKAGVFFDLAIALKCFGVSISYLVIIGDLIPKIVSAINPAVPSSSLLLDRRIWVSGAMLIVGPLAFFKRLSALKYANILAIFSVIYLVFIVSFSYFRAIATNTSISQDIPLSDVTLDFGLRWDNPAFFRYFPIFVFAFTCHQNIFSVYNEQRRKLLGNMKAIIAISIILALSCYLLLGICGYLSFGRSIQSNLIAMYPPGFLITSGQIAIAFLVLVSYPLQCHPCRSSLSNLFHTCFGIPGADASNLVFSLTTVGILGAGYAVAMLIANLSTVLAIVGATGSTMICYIFPSLFYFKLHLNDRVVLKERGVVSKRWGILMWLSLALGVYGIAVMLICLTAIIFSHASGH